MIRARWGALAILIVALFGAVTFAGRHHVMTLTPARKPRLALLTSLPILFGEDFSLKKAGSPALAKLRTRYRVIPISVTSDAELAKARLLVMAQPLAQTPENLVALDNWVRGGGRVLLLADPMLEWPSNRPLGDPLRPPAMFADTGLLAHWGLRLDAPDNRGPVAMEVRGHWVVYVSPGRLMTSSSSCVLKQSDIEAECRIGRGRAIVVADADFLNPSLADLHRPPTDNMAMLIDLLDSLTH